MRKRNLNRFLNDFQIVGILVGSFMLEEDKVQVTKSETKMYSKGMLRKKLKSLGVEDEKIDLALNIILNVSHGNMNKTYHVIKFNNRKMLISYRRIPKDRRLSCLYYYDIRHDDSGDPCTIENSVLVDFYGTLISRTPIALPDTDSVEGGLTRYRILTDKDLDSIDYTGQYMHLFEYIDGK